MANNGSVVSMIDLTFSFLFFLFSRSLPWGECDVRDEIQRIKAANPDISHREAFSAAAKNVSDLLATFRFLP
jgi:hypothetical protein